MHYPFATVIMLLRRKGEESGWRYKPCQCRGSSNSHRLVMPPDTVSMEKRELSIDDHPLTNSLQRPLKKAPAIPKSERLSVHQHIPVTHRRGGIYRLVRGHGYDAPRARECSNMTRAADRRTAARDQPEVRAEARGSKRDRRVGGGTCMM